MDRRKFLYQTALTTGGVMALSQLGISCVGSKKNNLFVVPDLDYDFNALEPHIDQQTMQIHHGKHFVGYTNKLNKAISQTKYANQSIEEILIKVKDSDKAIRNNAGGYYNHSLFFASLSPQSKSQPQGQLLTVIDRDFGSFDQFKDQFSSAAATVFGSGWAWLIANKQGELSITTTANQDNPLMSFTPDQGQPLMAIDVWEHAYYLNYQNKRTEYIAAFFEVLNWDYVADRYNAI